MLEVWNKLDLLPPAARDVLMPPRDRVFPLSALTGQGVAPLLAAIAQAFDEEKTDRTLTLPFAEGRKRAWLHDQGVVLSEIEGKDGHHLTVRWTARQKRRYCDL